MVKFPTYEEISKKVAEKALDEFLYNGKSIREWMQIIASEDAISRQVVKEEMIKYGFSAPDMTVTEFVEDLPPVMPQHEIGRCKDCQYFEHDTVAKVDGKLIFAHDICTTWGDGCKTREDGYCFMYVPKMQEGEKNE